MKTVLIYVDTSKEVGVLNTIYANRSGAIFRALASGFLCWVDCPLMVASSADNQRMNDPIESASTRASICPMPSISTRTTSPILSHGFPGRNAAKPPGVPVAITSPGSSVNAVTFTRVALPEMLKHNYSPDHHLARGHQADGLVEVLPKGAELPAFLEVDQSRDGLVDNYDDYLAGGAKIYLGQDDDLDRALADFDLKVRTPWRRAELPLGDRGYFRRSTSGMIIRSLSTDRSSNRNRLTPKGYSV
jgi:hypothetical protein